MFQDYDFCVKADNICNGICDSKICSDEEDCEFHNALRDSGFLVVQGGSKLEQDGVYELVRDSKGNPGFFRHSQRPWLFYRKHDGWALGSGTSPRNMTGTSITSSTSLSVPEADWSVKSMRVASVPINAFTREEMINGDSENDEGIICDNLKNQRAFYSRTRDDSVLCDKNVDCQSGIDEPCSCYPGPDKIEGCYPVVVTGSGKLDGIYTAQNPKKPYRHEDGQKIIFKEDGRWKLGKGTSPEKAKVYFRSGQSDLLPAEGWQDVWDEVKNGGKECGESVPDLHITKALDPIKDNEFLSEDGLVCKADERKWSLLRDKDICNGMCDCETCSDEETCEFHDGIKGIGFLVVRNGPKHLHLDGIYELSSSMQTRDSCSIGRTPDGHLVTELLLQTSTATSFLRQTRVLGFLSISVVGKVQIL